MSKEIKFRSRFLQASFMQKLTLMGAFELLLQSLSEGDIDSLVSQNIFFSYSYGPSSIIELTSVPSSNKMYLIIIEGNYLIKFLPEEIVAIILHEIGHSFNSTIHGIDGEYAADKFVKEKNYSKWIISSLQKGIKNNYIGFKKSDCDKRISNLY